MITAALGWVAAGCGGENVVGTGTVMGTVTDRVTGDPIAGARVLCGRTEEGLPGQAISDSEGRFVIGDLHIGRTVLQASAPGYEPNAVSSLEVVGRTTIEVDVALTPGAEGSVIVRGVVFSETGDPLEGALVASGPVRTRSDAVGRYSLQVPAGSEDLCLRFEAEGWRPVWRTVPRSRVRGGEVLCDARLSRSGSASITGTVIDAHDGTPIPGVSVGARTYGLTTETDHEGSYRLEALLPGRVDLMFAARGYREERRSVLLQEGEGIVLDVPLVCPSFGEILAEARDAATGDPVPEVTVTTVPLNRSATTDEYGEARLERVPSGDYQLRFHAPRYEELLLGPIRVDPRTWPSVTGELSPIRP